MISADSHRAGSGCASCSGPRPARTGGRRGAGSLGLSAGLPADRVGRPTRLDPGRTRGAFTGWLRPREHWLGSLPTFDVEMAWREPVWAQDEPRWTTVLGERRMTPEEFTALHSALPTDEQLKHRPREGPPGCGAGTRSSVARAAAGPAPTRRWWPSRRADPATSIRAGDMGTSSPWTGDDDVLVGTWYLNSRPARASGSITLRRRRSYEAVVGACSAHVSFPRASSSPVLPETQASLLCVGTCGPHRRRNAGRRAGSVQNAWAPPPRGPELVRDDSKWHGCEHISTRSMRNSSCQSAPVEPESANSQSHAHRLAPGISGPGRFPRNDRFPHLAMPFFRDRSRAPVPWRT